VTATVGCPSCGNADPELIAGIQLQGVYDGVCYWQCIPCGAHWHRFGPGDRRRSVVQEAWDRWAADEPEAPGEDR
jgi:hypothetical protein